MPLLVKGFQPTGSLSVGTEHRLKSEVTYQSFPQMGWRSIMGIFDVLHFFTGNRRMSKNVLTIVAGEPAECFPIFGGSCQSSETTGYFLLVSQHNFGQP